MVQSAYKGKSLEEWNRLDATAYARTEFLITKHCLERYLPNRGSILDAGSGPGRYAVHLARQGYKVTLLDVAYEMLRVGQEKIDEADLNPLLTNCIEGDISALPFRSEAFDAVVSLGAPLSHLLQQKVRARAVTEMVRVLKPNGCLIVTGLTRISLYRAMAYWMNEDLVCQFRNGEIQQQGIFHGWITGYAFQPGEIANLMRDAGVQVLDEVGCEGIAAHLPLEHLEQIEKDPELWQRWNEVLLETCAEPSVVGISNHLLLAGRKQEVPK